MQQWSCRQMLVFLCSCRKITAAVNLLSSKATLHRQLGLMLKEPGQVVLSLNIAIIFALIASTAKKIKPDTDVTGINLQHEQIDRKMGEKERRTPPHSRNREEAFTWTAGCQAAMKDIYIPRRPQRQNEDIHLINGWQSFSEEEVFQSHISVAKSRQGLMWHLDMTKWTGLQ